MIKKILIDFPELKVKLEREFEPGTNLIEEKNGWGKTTLLKTIVSAYTGKFGSGPLPAGTAKIETDNGTYLLSNGKWVGVPESNQLAKFVMPGVFFDMDTPKQRLAIVELLGIDRESFMKERVPDWTDKMKSELNAKIKFNAGKEDEILEDIMKLKASVLEYESNPVVEVDNSEEIRKAYEASVADYENKRAEALKLNMENSAKKQADVLRSSALNKELAKLRQDYEEVQKNPVCERCGSKLTNVAADLEKISKRASEIKEELKSIETSTPTMSVDIPPQLPVLSLTEMSAKVGIELKRTSEEELQRKRAYSVDKRSLEEKQAKLKAIGELEDKKVLEKIEESEREFTKKLEESLSELSFKVDLFETLKNGNVKETFIVYDGGVPYSELSNGRKAIVQFQVAVEFAKRLGIDTILLDEAGTMSKESLGDVLSVSSGMQTIIARATPFAKKDLK